ncbi:hypothetical protein SAY86_029569 [Trapa natans]|uniref:Sialate O-acetylesterase domain-containing protein n=1 Tax=Trapa natans TaxID=22666 RepID=A0AAN7MMF3_TRANT|nr:hypothetical protein SAY86_029569 [Trapa natans]
MLWQQGGADSKANDTAIAYEALLSQFFRDLTEYLNSPDFMILQRYLQVREGGVHQYCEGGSIQRERTQLSNRGY